MSFWDNMFRSEKYVDLAITVRPGWYLVADIGGVEGVVIKRASAGSCKNLKKFKSCCGVGVSTRVSDIRQTKFSKKNFQFFRFFTFYKRRYSI